MSPNFIEPGMLPAVDKPHAFPAPAAESAYDFEAVAFYHRTVARRRGAWWLDERDDLRRTREIVRETTRWNSRRHSIFAPGQAEFAVNEALRRRLDGRRTWDARVELTAPEPVREVLRAALREQHEIDAKARADERRLNTTELLRRRWDEFLIEAAKSHTAPHALKLVEEPAQVADVLGQMLDERQEDTRELLSLVTRIVEAHRSAGLLELVVRSDTVLRQTLTMMGIALPAQDPDAPLIPSGTE